ncbi:MAG TPA: hypothetical protein VGH22_21255 [Candidatus Binatia bacterium]|jgi:hypothetical protein
MDYVKFAVVFLAGVLIGATFTHWSVISSSWFWYGLSASIIGGCSLIYIRRTK